MWETPRAEVVQEAVGKKSEMTYIRKLWHSGWRYDQYSNYVKGRRAARGVDSGGALGGTNR